MGEPVSAGLPPLVQPGPELSAEQLRRYARNLRVPQIGELGQRRLRAARVLCVGAGGLGAPALLYLAAAGIGRLGILDDDDVELSNLQRQVIHGVAGVGTPKASSAARAVRELNPEVEVVELRQRLDAANAPALVAGWDLVLDGSDNFATRYAVSDACEIAGIPHVWGSILRFDGQLAVFWAEHGPTYRDLHPVPAAVGTVPSCSEAGVLGALPGVIGSAMALEAMKLITGAGRPLVGRLSIHDALDGIWSVIPLRRCATAVPVTRMSPFGDPLRDGYPGADGAVGSEGSPGCSAGCSTPAAPAAADAFGAARGAADDADLGDDLVSTAELRSLLERRAAGELSFELVDVREPWEHRLESIPGARLVPLGELEGGAGASSFPSGEDAEVILHCQSGARSARALSALRAADRAAGIRRRVRHLEGGISAWSAAGEPTASA